MPTEVLETIKGYDKINGFPSTYTKVRLHTKNCMNRGPMEGESCAYCSVIKNLITAKKANEDIRNGNEDRKRKMLEGRERKIHKNDVEEKLDETKIGKKRKLDQGEDNSKIMKIDKNDVEEKMDETKIGKKRELDQGEDNSKIIEKFLKEDEKRM